jgi:endonuclease/exonuclease/phosphatase family metal-dependent hydrolase
VAACSGATGTGDAGLPADAGRGNRFSVATLNILYGLEDEDPGPGAHDYLPERLPLIAAELASLRPEVVLLQEVAKGAGPPYPDVPATLLRAMNEGRSREYSIVSGDILGSPPVPNTALFTGQATLSRLPIVAKDNHAVVMVEPFSPRAVLHTRLRTQAGDVDVFNTHLTGPDDQDAATTEMKDLVAYVDSVATEGSLTILGGDLNSTEELPVFDVLRKAGFVDTGAACGLVCTESNRSGCTNTNVPLTVAGRRAKKRLDYIWVRSREPVNHHCRPLFDQPFTLADGGVLWASDHSGLVVELERP